MDKRYLIMNHVDRTILFAEKKLSLSSYDWAQSYKGILVFNEKFSTIKQKCIWLQVIEHRDNADFNK